MKIQPRIAVLSPSPAPVEARRARFIEAFQAPYTWTSITAMAGVAIGSLDNYVVNTAMPRILRDLGEPVFYAWVTSAFMLCTVVGLSLWGAWKDRSGLGTPFLAAVAVFGIGSLACAFTPSMSLLVLSRGFQGLGAGGITACCFAATASYPEAIRLRMFSLTSSVWGGVSLFGPLLGGAITDFIGWRWIFLLNVPLCVLAAALSLKGFARTEAADRGRRIPVVRAILLAVAVGGLVGAPSAVWAQSSPGQALISPIITAALLLAVGVAAGWTFLRQEVRSAVPVIPLSTWTGRGPVGSSMLCTMFFTAAFMGSGLFVSLYLQSVRGESALVAGLVSTASGIGWTTGSLLGSQVRGPWPRRLVTVGALLLALAGLSIAAQAAIGDAPLVFVYVTWGVAALGMGMSMIHLFNWAIVFSPPSQVGTISSAVQTVRTIGAAAGGALMGAILNAVGPEGGQLRVSITAIFLAMTVCALWPATLGRPRVGDRPGAAGSPPATLALGEA